MADTKYLDDTDNENETDQDEKPITISRTTLMLLVALGVTLIALSITTTLLVINAMEPDPVVAAPPSGAEASPTAAPSDETLTADAQAPGENAGEAAPVTDADLQLLGATEQVVSKAQTKPAIYYPINPPLIVNFDARGRQRFLQAELALMTRDNDVINAIELHMPMIRNSLILLIGGHLYEELQTAEGKELLRQQCLQELQRLMQQEIGKPGIEQVLFTNFVMQ